MLFLLPIPIALVLATIWASWASKPPRPADPVTSVEEWSRAIRLLAPEPVRQPVRLPVAAHAADDRELLSA